MSDKKVNIIEEINQALLSMNDKEKSYLMGFLEGFAALVGVGTDPAGGVEKRG